MRALRQTSHTFPFLRRIDRLERYWILNRLSKLTPYPTRLRLKLYSRPGTVIRSLSIETITTSLGS